MVKEGGIVSSLFVLVHVCRASGRVFQITELLVPVVTFYDASKDQNLTGPCEEYL